MKYKNEMRYYIVLGAIILTVVVGVFWYFSQRTPKITNFPSSGTDVIAFGDSLVAGNGSTPSHDIVSLLSDTARIPIINLGVAGNTTADGLARIHELDQYHPKLVLLLLGGNDYLQRVPVTTTFANLSKIIEYIESKGAIVLLLGIRGGILSDPYASQFEKLHDTYHTAYLSDVLSGVIGHSELLSDEVHPNDTGYAFIAARILPVLTPLLK